MSLIVDEHREYLRDAVRLKLLERAIAHVVRQGDVVVDLGSGTGVLGILACRAGARRVYALEAGGMIEVARAMAAANGVADRIVFIKRHSTEVTLPELADVLVSDFLSGLGFESGLFPLYADAKRLLKPDARRIPSAIDMHIAPVEDQAFHDEINFWDGAVSGVDTRAVLPWARNTGYRRMLQPSNVLATETVHAAFDVAAGQDMLRLRGDVAVSRHGTMHGIGGWFNATLAPGVTMSNAPDAPERPSGKQNLFLPLDTPILVAPGDRVALHVRIRPADLVVSWQVEARTAAGTTRFRHSTLGGMLLAREDVRAGDPAWTPRLTQRGEARRTVLELCDGRRPLAEIEREVLARHPALFRSAGEAQAFVSEMLTRYARDER